MKESIAGTGDGSGSLVRVAGGLGMAAVITGLSILVGSCGGFEGALTLSFLPVVFGMAGIVLSVVGAIFQQNSQDTHVIAAAFPGILGVIGGLVEMAAWLHWPIFFKP